MASVSVVPKPDSYVLEWVAVQNQAASSFAAMRRLVKNTPWVVQMVLQDDGTHFAFTRPSSQGLEQWDVLPDEWVVASPHGRFWFMSQVEFESQFDAP